VERLVLPAEFSWVRYLSYAGGILRFSWDDAAFYRLAELEGDELGIQTVPISGGVHSPLGSGGRVYHIGHFSEGSSLCAFPDDRGQLSFSRYKADWEDAPELLSVTQIRDPAVTPAASPYRVLRWLLPRFWLPSAMVDAEGLSSAGAIVFIADPAERLDAALSALWNFRLEAVDLQLELVWKRWSMPLSFQLYDTFLASADGQRNRVSGLFLGVAASEAIKAGGDFSWNLGTAFEGYGKVTAGTSPYVPWTYATAAFESGFGYQDLIAPLWDKERVTGFAAGALLRMDAPVMPGTAIPFAGLEARLAGYLGPGALKLELHGAVSLTGGLEYGPEGRVYPSGQIRAGNYPAWAEFAGGDTGSWFAEGETSFRLLGAELQKNIGAFYANRFSIRMGVRGAMGAQTAWSAFSRLSLSWTPAIGTFSLVHPSSYLEIWTRPDLATNGFVPHGLSFMLASSY
jgi:hypothetical protein